MFRSLVLGIVLTSSAWGMVPQASFVKKESFGPVQNFRDEKADVDLTTMASEVTFDDLNKTNVKALDELVEQKKEYGKVFGFKDWNATGKKLIDENGNRIFVMQGTYKDNSNEVVNFLEVYWANKTTSAQYLITSNSKKLTIDQYKQYLK